MPKANFYYVAYGTRDFSGTTYSSSIIERQPNGKVVKLVDLGPDDGYAHPSVSPNGRQIAFIMEDCYIPGSPNPCTPYAIGDSRVVVVMNIDGTNEHVVSNNEAFENCDASPQWSPDGQWVYFQQLCGYYVDGVYKVHPDGTDQTLLSKYSNYPGFAFSPDGTKIAYVGHPDETSGAQVYVANIDGSNAVTVPNQPPDTGFSNYDPVWTPDSKAIVFASEKEVSEANSVSIDRINTDGSGLTQLMTAQEVGELAVSPDGKTVVWSNVFEYSLYAVAMNGNMVEATIAQAPANTTYAYPTFGPLIGQPQIQSLSIAKPSPTDALLTRGLTIMPSANGATIAKYQFGWAPAGQGATAPTKPLQVSAKTHVRLVYGVTSPNSGWLLFARAIGTDGTVGPWSAPSEVHGFGVSQGVVHTPKAPILVAIGDSITSGHHLIAGDKGHTKCEDPDYGYAAAFYKRWEGALPTQWRFANNYQNVAISGFATQHGPGAPKAGSVVSGGRDACQSQPKGSPLTKAESLLKATRLLKPASDSWNRVIATGGIDDTNWGGVLFNVITTAWTTSITWDLTTCNALVRLGWNGFHSNVKKSITAGAKQIVTGLRSADPSVKITWVGYYNIANTGNRFLIPITCEPIMQYAMDLVDKAIKAGLPSNVTFVNIDKVMHDNGSYMQPLDLSEAVNNALKNGHNPPGWPHPNPKGAKAIAALLDPQ